MNDLKSTTINKRKIGAGFAVFVIVLLCFAITTYAFIMSSVSVEENLFTTGEVRINMNDSVPIITEEEFVFEPGMTVVKDFFVENESTIDVYYRVYLENVEGRLADILDVTLKEGDAVLYKGKASGMTATDVDSSEDTMEPGEVRWLNISFCYPYDGGNNGKNTQISFDVCVEAVQTKNNPDKEFD